MKPEIKAQQEILAKLKIKKLNPMQHKASSAIRKSDEVILLSPTGTGKTLAFLLPIIARLNPEKRGIQVLILTPSRELAMQIEQVVREMGTGYKVNAAYGGRPIAKDKAELKHPPAILVGTPGRIADHFRRGTVSPDSIRNLVLDEFDKSLEVGFEKEMKEIVEELTGLDKKILTSATKALFIPAFVGLSQPDYIDFLHEEISYLKIKTIVSPQKDKLETLANAIRHLGDKPGIVFCNYKESIQRVSDFLTEDGIEHGCFYGGMEQQDREQSLIKFRNGTHQLIVATDLAARGIDIPEIEYIIHYHLPHKSQEFTHRNGRTARMHQEGTAYVLKWKEETLPDFIKETEEEILTEASNPPHSAWTTLMITGGRKDKISKGDIAGLLFKQANLEKDEVGLIELKRDFSFVAVKKSKVSQIIQSINNQKVKKRKIRAKIV